MIWRVIVSLPIERAAAVDFQILSSFELALRVLVAVSNSKPTEPLSVLATELKPNATPCATVVCEFTPKDIAASALAFALTPIAIAPLPCISVLGKLLTKSASSPPIAIPPFEFVAVISLPIIVACSVLFIVILSPIMTFWFNLPSVLP